MNRLENNRMTVKEMIQSDEFIDMAKEIEECIVGDQVAPLVIASKAIEDNEMTNAQKLIMLCAIILVQERAVQRLCAMVVNVGHVDDCGGVN